MGDTQLEKICCGCGQSKVFDDFTKDNTRKGGLDKYCKDCKSLRKCGIKIFKGVPPYQFRHCRVGYCKTCGKVFPIITSRVCCKDCYSEARKSQHKLLKKKAIDLFREYRDRLKSKGCVVCGYNRCLSALEFHHIGKNKDTTISNIKSIKKLENEIKNGLVVLCANCHREVHSELIDIGNLKELVVTECSYKLNLAEGM